MNMTRGRGSNPSSLFVLLMIIAGFGCTRAPAPLDLTSSDPAHDQLKLASYHSREALFFRLQAEALSQRVAVYERLFGRQSEWVSGARLLVQFYEGAASEEERLAGWHLDIAGDGRPLSTHETHNALTPFILEDARRSLCLTPSLFAP